jgi:hypothetical protein
LRAAAVRHSMKSSSASGGPKQPEESYRRNRPRMLEENQDVQKIRGLCRLARVKISLSDAEEQHYVTSFKTGAMTMRDIHYELTARTADPPDEAEILATQVLTRIFAGRDRGEPAELTAREALEIIRAGDGDRAYRVHVVRLVKRSIDEHSAVIDCAAEREVVRRLLSEPS